jgi:hypothetical protein
MSFDGGGEVLEDVAFLETTGFDGREHPLHESTAGGALRSERQLAPDHRMAKGTLRGVIGGFDTFMINEGPEPFAMVVQLFTHSDETVVIGEDTAQQQGVHRGANGGHPGLKNLSGDLAGTMIAPMLEDQFDLPHQVVSQPFHLSVGVIDQGLKITFEMNPTPLQVFDSPIHLGSVAVDDSRISC